MKHNPNLRFSGCGPPLVIAMLMLLLLCIAGIALRPIAFWCLQQYHGIDLYTNAHYLSEPYIHEDKIYFGAGECFYQLQLDGTALHEIACGNGLFESPVGNNRYVYAQLNSNLVAISLETGKIAWRAHTPFANAERQFARTETQLFLVNDTVVSWRGSGISVYSTRTRKTIGHYRNWAINSVWVYDNRLWFAANPASEWSSFETFLKVLREEPTSPSSYPRHANTIMVMALDTGQVQSLIDATALGTSVAQSLAIIGLDAAQISIHAISALPGSDRELRVPHHNPLLKVIWRHGLSVTGSRAAIAGKSSNMC